MHLMNHAMGANRPFFRDNERDRMQAVFPSFSSSAFGLSDSTKKQLACDESPSFQKTKRKRIAETRLPVVF
jgi:hypothetical protein